MKYISAAKGKVVLKKFKEEKKSGTLILPDQNGVSLYQIVDININDDYQKDDIVVIGSNYPYPLDLDGEIFYLVEYDDILATIVIEG